MRQQNEQKEIRERKKHSDRPAGLKIGEASATP
jgi:hypothetical protein